MKKRQLSVDQFLCHVFILCVMFVVSTVQVCAEESIVAAKPNVLLIVADDVGVGDLRSFYPSAITQTPNIDQLALQGMRFTRFYTESTCSASRAALLTGQYAARQGFHPIARGISSEVLTMADWFRQQGYSTHHVGKWHLGEVNAQAAPVFQGFDTSFGFMNQWFLQGPDTDGVPVMKAPIYENPWLQNERDEWKPYTGYLPDILTADAVNKIESFAHNTSPWFMYYATPLAHAPVHMPPVIEATGAPSSNLASMALAPDEIKYQAMVAHLDANVGQLLNALDHSGQRGNTIIVFVSDNGAPEKRTFSNGSLGGGKGRYTEGGIRAPMIWVDPTRIVAGSLDERAIAIMDIFPTLAARLDAPLPSPVDGLDITSISNIPAFQKRALFWLTRDSYSLLSSDKYWRLTEQWMMQTQQALHWSTVTGDVVEDKTSQRWLSFLLINAMRKDAEQWITSVVKTPVIVQSKKKEGGEVLQWVTGSDFLRTPLKEWDFYIAIKPDIHSQSEQIIAEQKGIWSALYLPQSQKLRIRMHGGEWDVPLQLTDDCSLLGLNADIYDRYTNVSTTQNASRLRVSMNGVELAHLEWKIDTLGKVAVEQPTQIGGSSSNNSLQWRGQLSVPVFYHWSSQVGEWPFFIDEKKLRTETCAQLEKQS